MKHRLSIPTLVIIFILCGWMFNAAYAAVNRGLSAPVSALPGDLKNVTVRDYFLPSNTREIGEIQTVMAHVVVARSDLKTAYFAANGDKVYEKDVVFTLADSKCRIKLHNKDIITIGDNTRMSLKEAFGTQASTIKKSVVSIIRGKAMFYAIKLFRQKDLSMTIEAPTAVVGVRGTKFGVEVMRENDKAVGVQPLLLADSSDDWGRYLIAQAGSAGGVTTTVHGFEGTVAVTSTITGATSVVNAGQTLETSTRGLGSLMPTPPEVSRRFQSQTTVPPPGGTSGGGDTSSAVSGGQTASGDSTTTQAATEEASKTISSTVTDTSTVAQTQTTKKEEEQKVITTDPVSDPKTNFSGTKVGYLAGMLSNITGGKLEEVFVSQNRYDTTSNTWGRGLKSPGQDHIRVHSSNGIDHYLQWVTFDSATKTSNDLGTAVPFASSTKLGENNVMQWGWTVASAPFTVDTLSYGINNRLYYIEGANTPSLSGFSGTAGYSGNAYGTYWSAAGGANMTGTFKGDVNFTNGSISNFNLSVSGDGAQASISGASGSMGSDAHFGISGGTWDLNGVTPDQQSATGSLYGSSAEYIGGPWGMYSTSTEAGAVGIFQGSGKPQTPPDTVSDSRANSSGSNVGYFSAMLTNHTLGKLEEVFVSKNRYPGQEYAWARGTKSPDLDFIRVEGFRQASGATQPYLRYVDFGGDTKRSGALTDYPISSTVIGTNTYMEWGYATVPKAFIVDGSSYLFDNRAYYVFGYNTPSLSGFSGTANYNGNAYGTSWSQAGGVNMTGTFGCDVNYTSAALSNFGLSVSGGGAQASISNASGTIGSDAHFAVSGGTWNLNGVTPDQQSAAGSLFGPDGSSIGGPWGMYSASTETGAVGIYQGSKTAVIVDPVVDPGTNYSGVKAGYVSAMLSNNSNGSLEEVFVSRNRYDTSSNIWARGTKSSSDYIRLDGNTSLLGTPYLKWVTFQSGAKKSGDLSINNPLTSAQMGANVDMVWGYSTMANTFDVDSTNYGIDNRAYWVFGTNTPSLSGFSGTASYSGNAYGTYWNSSGGVNMTGTFGCDVNYTTAAVSNFNVHVSGGGAYASICEASGSIGSDVHFTISGGTWDLNGVEPDQQSAAGSLYGSAADYVGGPWGMYSSSTNTGAAGIYQGAKVATDPVVDPGTNTSGTKAGYFASLLANMTGNSLEEVFVSQNRYDTTSNSWARGLKSTGQDYMRVDGNGGGNPYLKWVTFQSGTKKSGDLGTSQLLATTVLGSNSDLEWGYHTLSSTFIVDSTSYGISTRNYWINGTNTPSLSGFSGTASYSGSAYGTYWNSSGGANMTGNFTTDVNYTGGTVSNFNLSVSGSGASASISNASGTIGSDTHFALSGGTWLLNGVTPDQTSAAGSLYGSSADYIGGPWGMYNSSTNTGAAGIYAGSKVTGPVAQSGYYVGMVENCSFQYVDTYITESRQDFTTSDVYAMNLAGGWSVSINGTSTPKNMALLSVSPSAHWTGSEPVSFTKISSNAYMEWGTWTQPTNMLINGTNYSFKNKGAYVWGDVTTDAQMATLKSNTTTGVYSGTAWGTMFGGNGAGTDMTGSFSAVVNFASPAVTNFNLSVANGSNAVAITNASGSFTGSTSHFTISPSSGNWTINSTSATDKAAYGSVYGTNGNAIGGPWTVGGAGVHAVGGYQGVK
jgi:hypothetical protein